MFYPLLRKLLFCLDPEVAHKCSLQGIDLLNKIHLSRLFFPKINDPLTCMGITFPNRIGLSAGFDRNGEYLAALSALGFGFIEMGTVIPRYQAGNSKPRIFRLPKDEALINRMGFASAGLDYVVKQLEKTKYKGVLGINIGKCKDTPNEKAVADYLLGFQALAKFASYITINISSPNTAGLRDLLKTEYLATLVSTLKNEQAHFHKQTNKYVPLVVKISPDLSDEDLLKVCNVLTAEKVDGVIACNTTLSREGLSSDVHAQEAGGLSGHPLYQRNLAIVKKLREANASLPIMASGGITDENAAIAMHNAGASLIQIYTGFIYQGPGLIKRLVKTLKK